MDDPVVGIHTDKNVFHNHMAHQNISLFVIFIWLSYVTTCNVFKGDFGENTVLYYKVI